MARPNFPLSIDRRRLLKSTVGATAAGILPLAGSTEAGAVQAIIEPDQPPSLTPEVRPRNVSAATTRRLLEIAKRNEIRREAELPALSIAKELRRMKRQEETVAFERFATIRRAATWEQVLQTYQESKADPAWWPSWMAGVSLQSKVDQLLRKQFCRTVRRELQPFQATKPRRRFPDTPEVA